MRTEHTILRLGHHGDGIADGPVYATRTLPGERVSGVLDGQRLTEIRIETPSAYRVHSPCRHYKRCGGCQMQHVADQFVEIWKTGVVEAALSAKAITATFRPVITSPPNSRLRAVFGARRTKSGAQVGFHSPGSDVIVEIPDCLLITPTLKATLPVLESLAKAGASRKAALSVTMADSVGGVDVSVQNGKPLDRSLRVSLAGIAERNKLARLAWNDDEIATLSVPKQRFGPASVVPPHGAFLQATQEGQSALTATVLEIANGARRVVDLFSGCGTFSLPLVSSAEVHAVEADAAMNASLIQGWRGSQGLKRLTTETRDLFRRPLIPDELTAFDVAILDPPRAGAEAQVAEFARARLPAIGYVSCNPVTFARDAKRLVSAGYTLDWVQVIDQFRWSAHVELVAAFSMSSGATT